MVVRLREAMLVSLLSVGLFFGCTKDERKVVDDTPKKSTPVPDDMGSFNDFLPKAGGAEGLAVKLDGGLEAGLAAVGPGEPPPGEDDKGSLKVLEPGAEPRAARKYTFTANKVEKRLVTLAQEAPRPGAPAISILMNLDFVPKKVQPSGSHWEAKVTKVDIPGAANGAAQQAQLAQALGAMNGLTASFDVTSHGEPSEISFSADPRMQNELAEAVINGVQQSIDLVFPPLPSAPIGAGAVWLRETDRKETGVEQKSKAKFTLKEVTSEGGVIEAEVETKIPKRAVSGPGVPPGASVGIDAKGKYTYQFRFDRLSTKVEGEQTVVQHLEVVDESGKKQSADQTQKAKHTIQIPPAAGGK